MIIFGYSKDLLNQLLAFLKTRRACFGVVI